MKNENSIKALVRLIEDPDENIFRHVRDELVSYGDWIIPMLESSWEEEEFGLLFQTRVEDLIHEIQFDAVKNALKDWIHSSERDLLEGTLIISRYQYPNFEEQLIRSKIQEIRKDIWLELNDRQTAYEKIRVFNKIFFGKYRFSGNSQDYHSPLNSCINTVIEMRKGNPLSLSILYSIIAQSLDIPVYGVNLPNHFVLAYLDRNGINEIVNPQSKYGCLFYINAFSKGGIFDEQEIRTFLKGLNMEERREYFEPCSNSAIIQRMITNLLNAFQQIGNVSKVNELLELRELFDLDL